MVATRSCSAWGAFLCVGLLHLPGDVKGWASFSDFTDVETGSEKLSDLPKVA